MLSISACSQTLLLTCVNQDSVVDECTFSVYYWIPSLCFEVILSLVIKIGPNIYTLSIRQHLKDKLHCISTFKTIQMHKQVNILGS